MLTDEQVWQVLCRDDLLSGWPILPADDARGREEKARAWAEQLDEALTFPQAMAAVEQHCRYQWRPLAIADLNAAAQHRPAPSQPPAEVRGSGALQRIIAEQGDAVPVPPDVDLHRYRHRTPRFMAEARQRPRGSRRTHLSRTPSRRGSSLRTAATGAGCNDPDGRRRAGHGARRGGARTSMGGRPAAGRLWGPTLPGVNSV